MHHSLNFWSTVCEIWIMRENSARRCGIIAVPVYLSSHRKIHQLYKHEFSVGIQICSDNAALLCRGSIAGREQGGGEAWTMRHGALNHVLIMTNSFTAMTTLCCHPTCLFTYTLPKTWTRRGSIPVIHYGADSISNSLVTIIASAGVYCFISYILHWCGDRKEHVLCLFVI